VIDQQDFLNRLVEQLYRLGDGVAAILARQPELEPQFAPVIAAIRQATDLVSVQSSATVGLGELRTLLETMKIDPRFHPSDLA